STGRRQPAPRLSADWSRLKSSSAQPCLALVGELNRMAVGAIAAIRRHHRTKGDSEPYTLAGLCTRSGEKMREVLDRATRLVNYGPGTGGDAAQAVADA